MFGVKSTLDHVLLIGSFFCMINPCLAWLVRVALIHGGRAITFYPYVPEQVTPVIRLPNDEVYL